MGYLCLNAVGAPLDSQGIACKQHGQRSGRAAHRGPRARPIDGAGPVTGMQADSGALECQNSDRPMQQDATKCKEKGCTDQLQGGLKKQKQLRGSQGGGRCESVEAVAAWRSDDE